MGMHEPGSSRLGRQSIAKMAMGGDFKAFLFRCPVYGRRDYLAVPMDKFGSIRVVEQIDGYRNAFTEPD